MLWRETAIEFTGRSKITPHTHTHTKHTVWERVRNKLLKNSNIYGGVEKTLTDGSKTGKTKGKPRKPRVS